MSEETTTAATPEVNTAAIVDAIKSKFDNKVDVLETKFHFKKVTDSAGNDYKRPTVGLKVPRPSLEGLLEILTSGVQENASPKDKNQFDLVFEAIGDVILARARELVNAQEDVTQDNFPMEQLSWEAIANLPKAERKGGGISQDTWKEFVADYVEVMLGVTGKAKDKLEMACKVYLNKFQQTKTDKPVLKLLKDQLTLYISHTPKAEDFAECVEFLVNKADTFINAESTKLLDNL